MSSFLTRWFLSVDVEAAGLGLRSPPSNSTFLARPSLDAPKNLHVVRNMNVADGESIRRDASGYLFRGVYSVATEYSGHSGTSITAPGRRLPSSLNAP